MKGVKFKLIDMVNDDCIKLKAPTLPRVGETIYLASASCEVIYVDHVYQRCVTGGYVFKEFVVVVKWK